MRQKLYLVLLTMVIPALAFAQTTWKPISSEISFKIKNTGATVTGRFTGLQTTLKFSPDKISSSTLDGSVEVATIKTGIDKRDRDLLEEKYFNADKIKKIELKSTKLYKKGEQFAGMFNITIKGVTKQMEIPFQFKQTGNDATFNSSFTINRRDFGVGGKSMMMSDDLTVNIVVKAKS